MKLISEDAYISHGNPWKKHKYIRKDGNRYIYAEDLRSNPNVTEVAPGDYRYTKGFHKGNAGKAATLGYVSSFQVGEYERKHRAGQGAYHGTAASIKKSSPSSTARKGLSFMTKAANGGLLTALISEIIG